MSVKTWRVRSRFPKPADPLSAKARYYFNCLSLCKIRKRPAGHLAVQPPQVLEVHAEHLARFAQPPVDLRVNLKIPIHGWLPLHQTDCGPRAAKTTAQKISAYEKMHRGVPH